MHAHMHVTELEYRPLLRRAAGPSTKMADDEGASKDTKDSSGLGTQGQAQWRTRVRHEIAAAEVFASTWEEK